MEYQVQNFKDGQVLTAEHLNHIESAITHLVRALDELDTGSNESTCECNIKRIKSNIDGEPLVNMRDIDSGTYLLYGYFSPYENSDISISADNSLVSVIWKNAGSHLICLDPLNAKIVFFEILVDENEEKGFTYTRTIIPLLDLYGLIDRVALLEQSGGGGSGVDGFSPLAVVNETTDGATITITDINGTTTATVKHGKDGKDGTDGTDGVSPTVAVSKSGKVTTIAITDKNGTKTATINDGKDGSDGESANEVVTTTGSGSVYNATVPSITALTTGATFIMIPHTVSTIVAPKLNVNGLGEKSIRRRLSNSTTSTVAGTSTNWLAANKPIRVMYDGSNWIADLDRPNAPDLYGTLALEQGGTGGTTQETACTNLGAVGYIPQTLTDEQKAQARSNIGAQAVAQVRIAEITLASASWVEKSTNLYSQVVSIADVTENTQVDLTPSVEQLIVFYEKDITLVAENESGTVTVYCIGQKPTNNYTIQVTLTEVY